MCWLRGGRVAEEEGCLEGGLWMSYPLKLKSPVTLRSRRLPGADVAACSLPLKSKPVGFIFLFFFLVCLVCEHL